MSAAIAHLPCHLTHHITPRSLPMHSQRDFIKSVRSQIGFNNTSTAGCPYDKFMCMNSGSEAVELSTRMTDVAAKIATGMNLLVGVWSV